MKVNELNLQLFADINTMTTGDNVSPNDVSPTMKTFYRTSLLENSRAKLYFNQFGKKQALPKNAGHKIEFRKWNTFAPALTPLTEGVTPDGTKSGMINIIADLNQYGDYTGISDLLELRAVDNVILGITEEHGAQAGETSDLITRNEVIAGTQVQYGGSADSRYKLTGDDKITGQLVAKVVTQLKKMKAPTFNGDYVAIIHPSVAYDLRQDSQWLEAHKYAKPKEIFTGEIGKLHGVRFVETTQAKVYKGAALSETTTLTVASAAAGTDTVTVSETLFANELVGRLVLIGTAQYLISENTTNSIKLLDPITETAASVTAAKDTVIYPGEGGAAGAAVYATMFLGKDAYAVIDPSAESLEVIIKQRGSAGTADPLDQRSTVGWKATHAAKTLYQERMVRLETGSTFSDVDEAN